jgi:ankyrin repeat protein
VDVDDSKGLEDALAQLDEKTLDGILGRVDQKPGSSKLYWRCVWKSSTKCLEVMVNLGCDVNAKYGSEQNTSLHTAARNNDEKLVVKLIQLGADRKILNGAGVKPADMTIDKTIHVILQGT